MKLSAYLGLLLLAIGCSAADKFSDVPNTFLEDVDIKAKEDALPFDHSWIRPEFKLAPYTTLYFKPVRVDKLPLDSWRRSSSLIITSQDDYVKQADELAKYFREQIVERMKAEKGRDIEMVEVDGDGVLVIEIALTELQFAKPVAQAGALASPIPGTGVAISAISEPHVSFAMRVTDSVTSEVVATAADRKFPPTRIVDFNKLTVTSSPREICGLWAKSIAQIFKSDHLTKIKEKRFSFVPW